MPVFGRISAGGSAHGGAQFLILCAKAHALLSGKYAPDVEDVQAVAIPTLRHRMVLSYQARPGFR